MLISTVTLKVQPSVRCFFDDRLSSLAPFKFSLFSVFCNFSIMVYVGLVVVPKFQKLFPVLPPTEVEDSPFSPWRGQFLTLHGGREAGGGIALWSLSFT